MRHTLKVAPVLGAVSKLRTLGLVEGRGTLRASDELF